MNIASLRISGFLGVAEVNVDTPEAVQLFAGPNAAGKSSVRDAIALALTSDLGRVALKKESGQLVRDGAGAAVCEVVDADGDQYRCTITPAGKITSSRRGDPDPVLAMVLDAQRLAQITPTERRAFLFDLMGVKTDPAAIAQRLLKAGHDQTRVDRLQPLLRSGFDAASKEAKGKATEAKGAWRAVTGETFGSEKAKTWRAAVPAFDKKLIAQFQTELQHCDVALDSWQRQVGAAEAEQAGRAALQAKVPALQEHAGRIQRIEGKLATDEQQLADWEADLAKTAAAAGAGPRVGLVHELARTTTDLMSEWPVPADDGAFAKVWEAALDALEAYTKAHGAVYADAGGDAAARARLPSVTASRDLLASAVANDKRDLAAAQAAKAQLEAIQQKLAQPLEVDLADATAKVAECKASRDDLLSKTQAQRTLQAQAEGADQRTKSAQRHADDVDAWDALGDALAPDGLPAEMLSQALQPLNDRLEQTAADTGWPEVAIDPEMAITAGGRAYRLLSESERWRADAALAEAVAQVSGTQLLVLDRFDVLDVAGRQELLGWLHTLADTREIDSAFLFGTLKALPAGLPATIATHWIQNGMVGQLKAAA